MPLFTKYIKILPLTFLLKVKRIDPDTADITIWNMEAPDIYSGNNSQAEIYVGYGDSETLFIKEI
jgi:hypothetical protein